MNWCPTHSMFGSGVAAGGPHMKNLRKAGREASRPVANRRVTNLIPIRTSKMSEPLPDPETDR